MLSCFVDVLCSAYSASKSSSSTAAIFHMRTDRMAALAYNSTAKTLCTYTTLAALCVTQSARISRCLRADAYVHYVSTALASVQTVVLIILCHYQIMSAITRIRLLCCYSQQLRSRIGNMIAVFAVFSRLSDDHVVVRCALLLTLPAVARAYISTNSYCCMHLEAEGII
jgi:hypothetical protein